MNYTAIILICLVALGLHMKAKKIVLTAPIVSSTYNSGSPSVSVALNNTSVTAILGTQTHMRLNPNTHTPKLFNGFVVLPTYL